MFALLLSIGAFWAALSPGGTDHDFKMSICEVIYEPSDRHFDVKIYLFTDDLTEAITGDPKAALPTREAISQYVLQHIGVQVNGVQQPLQFSAIRQKEEQVLVQFSTPSLGNIQPATIAVWDNIMLEKFREQTNMLYLIVPGKNKRTEALDAKRTSVEMKW
jgi:hypothetical protein